MENTVVNGDCLEVLKSMPDASVDSVVTDPPYGLSFMGKKWDYDVPGKDVWAECLRVLKPGGHLLSFAGTRTQHRMAVNIEDAGFEIRDMIAWIYGSGFPKSLDVSKAIDKAAGAEREVVGFRPPGGSGVAGNAAPDATGSHIWSGALRSGDAVTEPARQWQGWGTSLKPSLEPVTVARKPLEGTVAANVLEHGTGAINVDGCRVGTTVETWPKSRSYHSARGPKPRAAHGSGDGETISTGEAPSGRWPANLIHDGSDEVVGLFPVTGPSSGADSRGGCKFFMGGDKRTEPALGHEDAGGSAARFFYSAKASKKDRDEGCEGLEVKSSGECVDREEGSAGMDCPRAGAGRTSGSRNHHPTVKPTALMRYLVRLVTPPGGLVLDPFAGSGSTCKAAKMEGFKFIGIEREAEYVTIANARIAAVQPTLGV